MSAALLLCGLSGRAQNRPTAPGYPLGTSQALVQQLENQVAASARRGGGSTVTLRVSATTAFTGQVNYREDLAATGEYVVGEIAGVPGSSFFVRIEGKTVDGTIVLRTARQAYRYSADAQGNVSVQPVDINKVICVDYTKPVGYREPATPRAGGTANRTAVVSLQSLPGARGCVLLDFDGQYVSGTPWNNGNPINAASFNMSNADIQAFWELVSEDFRPFSVNITTDEAVFNTYPKTMRRRCIVTPTTTAYPGAGGVAYVGSFNNNDDTPCWVFMSDPKYGGDAASHELGHTLGLSHDGRLTPREDYYSPQGGTGAWAPIMGVSYYQPVAQWSKGEYNSANNQEDDLAIIASSTYNVGYRADDHSNSTAGATALTRNGTSLAGNGIIEQTADQDYFTFTTGGGTVSFTVNTVPRYGDLDIVARLYDSGGGLLGTYDTAGGGNLNVSFSTSLSAGTYYLSVDGTGSGNPATDGYSDYASLGTFSISGTASASDTPTNYCASQGSNVAYEYLALVNLGSINRTSGADGGYYDGTALNTSVAQGSAQTISFAAGFPTGTVYRANVTVYADWNQNGSFTDAGETVASGMPSSTSAQTASFTVPATAKTGKTRLRVVLSNDPTTSCGAYNYGETEDYSVTVSPANDLCANATALGCGQSLTGTTVGATATGDPTGSCTTSVDGGGVFYTITGTGADITLSTCSPATNFDTKLLVYTGDCGAYTCVAGNDDVACEANSQASAVTFPSVAGTVYRVFVSGYRNATGTFAISATCPGPANDLCANATPLSCGQTRIGTTAGATATGDPTSSCTTSVDGGGVFYTVTGTGADITLSTCSPVTNFDTKLFVYTGACGAYTCVAGNDDVACGVTPRASAVTFPSVAGTVYRVFVSGYQNATGTFAISATSATCGGAKPAAQPRPSAGEFRPSAGEFSVWPNPVAGKGALHIALAEPATKASVTLRSILGQVMATSTFSGSATELPVSGLAAGTYLLTVQTESGTTRVQRVVVE